MTAGEAFRQRYSEVFEPEHVGDELVLDRIVATLDRIEAMEARIEAEGFTTVGGNRQLVVHPLVSAIRSDTEAVAKLVRQLQLEPEGIATMRARKAANVRWAGVR